MSFALHPITPDEIPTLITIHDAAFADDVSMNLMYNLSGDKTDFMNFIRNSLLTNPTSRFFKAVDANGEIMGWSWWSIYLDGEKHAEDAAATIEHQKTPPKDSPCPELYLDYHRDVAKRREKWVTGKPASILQAIAVGPKHQRKGVGSALVWAGLDEAKRHGLPAWLEASSAGRKLYEKCGFRDVGEPIDIDLNKYGGNEQVRVVCMLHDVPS